MSYNRSTSKYVTDDDIAQVEKELENLKLEKAELALAEAAGLDVTAQKEQYAQLEAQANQFLAVYRKKKR